MPGNERNERNGSHGEQYQPVSQQPDMAYPQQPGYNPAYQNPYQQGGQAPPPPGFNTGNQQQGGAFFPPPPMPHHSMFNQGNVENGAGENGDPDGKYSFQFNSKTIRAAFVRKVFTLVFIMLAIVSAVTALPWIHKPLMQTVRYNMAMYWSAYIVFFVTYISLTCCEGARRKFPLNIIVTGIFTFATAVMTMVICAHHNASVVLQALAICLVCTLAIVVFASQTKFDLTAHVGFLAIISVCFIAFGFVAIISTMFFKLRILMTIYAFLGALFMMIYLFFDIQMLMGGRKLELSPEDYIFAAVQIFIDIVQMFWFILSLLGNSN